MAEDKQSKKRMSSEYIDMLGLCLGNFEIVEFFTANEVVAVFRGKDLSKDKEVAIKIIKQSPATDYLLSRLVKIKEISHPSIVSVHEMAYDEQCEGYYSAGRWYHGHVLEQKLQEDGRLYLQDALLIVFEIARALAHCHGQGLAHGNLTPENIILTEEETIMIDNLCLLPVHKEKAANGKPIFGVENYMAPEQYEGVLPDFITDIYSLGAIFWRMATGVYYDRQKSFSDNTQCSDVKLPDDILHCLQNLLEVRNKRYDNSEALVEELEMLYLKYKKVQCPYCDKTNFMNEVFSCFECETTDLCLTHLVAERQCCERCFKIVQANVTQRMLKPSNKNYPKLIYFLNHVQEKELNGVLVVGNREEVMALSIAPGKATLALEKFPNGFAGKSPLHSEPAFYAGLSQILSWKEFSFEFWQDKPLERIVPQNKTHITWDVTSRQLLPGLCQILQVWKELQNEGGIVIHSQKESAGFLFTRKGIVATTPAPEYGKSTAVLSDEKSVEILLQRLSRAPWEKIEHRNESSFPSSTAKIPLPLEQFSQAARNPNLGKIFQECIPKVSDLLPPTVKWNNPFGGVQLSTLSQTVCGKLFRSLEKLDELKDIVSPFTLSFIKLAVVKERTGDISKLLVEMAQNHFDKWEPETTENILLQASLLSPDNSEVFHLLGEFYGMLEQPALSSKHFARTGDLHWQNGDKLNAMACYEHAVEFNPDLLAPRLRLIVLHNEMKQLQKIEQNGAETWNLWNKHKQTNKVVTMEVIEQIGEILLKLNIAPNSCRHDLAAIYITQGRPKLAVQQYDELVGIYRKEKNRPAMIKAMVNVYNLDPTYGDYKERVEKLAGKDWKKMVEKPDISFYASKKSVAVSSFNFHAFMLKFSHARPLQIMVAVIVLLLGSWLFWPEKSEEKKTKTSAASVKKAKTNKQQQKDQYLSSTELASMWAEIEKWKKGGQEERVYDLCQKIVQKGDAAAKKRAQKELQRIENIFTLRRQQMNFLEQAHDLRKLGKYNEALVLFEKAKALNSDNEAGKQADKQATQIVLLEKKAKKIVKKGRSLEKKGLFAEALEYYQLLLHNSTLLHTSAAKTLEIPLVIEMEPAIKFQIKNKLKSKKFNKQYVLYRKLNDAIPEIKITLPKGFKEKERGPVLTKSKLIWKIKIIAESEALWHFEFPGEITTAAVAKNNYFYLGTRRGFLLALNAEGEKLWEYQAGAVASIHGIWPENIALYFGTADGYFYSLDRNTGQLRWKKKIRKAILAAPARLENSKLCFVAKDQFYLTDNNGKVIKSYFVKQAGKLPPVTIKKQALISAGDKVYYYKSGLAKPRLFLNKTGQLKITPVISGKSIYTLSEDGLLASWSFSRKLNWKKQLTIPYGQVSISNNVIYVSDQKGIYAFSGKSGKNLWKKSIRNIASWKLFEQNIYVLLRSGSVITLNRSGKLINKFPLERVENLPLILDKVLFVADETTIYAYHLNNFK